MLIFGKSTFIATLVTWFIQKNDLQISLKVLLLVQLWVQHVPLFLNVFNSECCIYRRRRRGAGGYCAPPKKQNCMAKKKIGQIRAKLEFSFFSFLVNYCCGITSWISCTPNPILKYRTDSGAVPKKSTRVPPPFRSARYSALAGIRAVDSGFVCAPPPKKKNELVPYRTPMVASHEGITMWPKSTSCPKVTQINIIE